MPEEEDVEEQSQESNDNISDADDTSEESSSEESQEGVQEPEENPQEKLRTQQALQLLAALEDPKTSLTVIKSLAESAGLQIGQPKQEQAEKTLRDEIQEALGSDWAFLADKVGPVIEKRLAKIEGTVNSRFEENTLNARKISMREAEKQFFNENPSARRFLQDMKSLSTDYPPPDSRDFKQYFADLYNIASAGKGSISDNVSKKRDNRARSNREESDLGKNAGRERSTPAKSNKRLTLSEAIASAASELRGKEF